MCVRRALYSRHAFVPHMVNGRCRCLEYADTSTMLTRAAETVCALRFMTRTLLCRAVPARLRCRFPVRHRQGYANRRVIRTEK